MRTFSHQTISSKMLARTAALAAAASFLAIAGTANAAEPESCKTVRISDVGWTDLASTNASFVTVLKALGYTPQVKTLGVPVTYSSMKNKDIDVFLGNWMPAQKDAIGPYLADKSIDSVGVNLEAPSTRSAPTPPAPSSASRISRTSPSTRPNSTARSTASSRAMKAMA